MLTASVKILTSDLFPPFRHLREGWLGWVGLATPAPPLPLVRAVVKTMCRLGTTSISWVFSMLGGRLEGFFFPEYPECISGIFRNIPEYSGIFRNIPEYIFRNMDEAIPEYAIGSA